MPKTTLPFDSGAYAPVADRIALFYERHPSGRIVTDLIERAEVVVFKARVYRDQGDRMPAATGWASERVGDGEINAVACVENTETSAIGRALANLGITAGRQRPSREEMEKAARARRQLRPVAASPAPDPDDATLALATPDDLAELADLLGDAERRGFMEGRGAEIRTLLERVSPGAAVPEPIALVTVRALQRELRAWLRRSERAR